MWKNARFFLWQSILWLVNLCNFLKQNFERRKLIQNKNHSQVSIGNQAKFEEHGKLLMSLMNRLSFLLSNICYFPSIFHMENEKI